MNSKDYELYLEEKAMDNLEIHSENCSTKWDSEFRITQKLHFKESNNVAQEYIQSWNAEESKRIGAEKLQQIGIETARELYPGFQFVVVPHVNRNGNYHNHIMIATVSIETGEKIAPNDFSERHRWNVATDKKCVELGLSVPNRKSFAKERLSREGHEAVKRGKTPIHLEVMKKADFARVVASSIPEYAAILSVLGIKLEDRGQVLTYHHPSRMKGIRDRSLGENYKKDGLNDQFQKNQKQFERRPDLQEHLRKELARIFDRSGNLVGDASQFPLSPGGHRRFEGVTSVAHGALEPNTGRVSSKQRSFEQHAPYIASIIARANEGSIVEYCKSSGIALDANKDGTYRLKGRSHILIDGNQWRNTKSKNGKPVGTRGSLLEFVSLHKDVSYLRALAEITGNSRLLVLEQLTTFEPITFKEFHAPKPKQAKELQAIDYLQHLSRHLGKKSDYSRALIHSKRVQVSTEGAIRFLFGTRNEGAIEYKQDVNRKWVKKQMGVLKGGILSKQGSGKSVSVFPDMFSFMDATKGKGLNAFSAKDSVLVLGDSQAEPLHYFLASNQNIKDVQLIGFDSRPVTDELSLGLKGHNVSVQIRMADSLSRNREKGVQIEL